MKEKKALKVLTKVIDEAVGYALQHINKDEIVKCILMEGDHEKILAERFTGGAESLKSSLCHIYGTFDAVVEGILIPYILDDLVADFSQSLNEEIESVLDEQSVDDVVQKIHTIDQLQSN